MRDDVKGTLELSCCNIRPTSNWLSDGHMSDAFLVTAKSQLSDIPAVHSRLQAD